MLHSEYVAVPTFLWDLVLTEVFEKAGVDSKLMDRLERLREQTKSSVRVRSQVQYPIPVNDMSMIDREKWAMRQLRTQLANDLHDAGLVKVDRYEDYFDEYGTISLQGSVEVLTHGS